MNRWVLVSMVLLVALSGCRNRYATVSEDLLPLAKELSPDRLFSEVLVRHDKDTSAQMKAMAYVSLGGIPRGVGCRYAGQGIGRCKSPYCR